MAPGASIGDIPMLFLPENYSEEQLGNMLSHAVNSPELIRSDAMVTVIDAPLKNPTQPMSEPDEDSFFKEFLVDDSEDPDALGRSWGRMEEPPEVVPAATMPVEILSDEVTPVPDIPDDYADDVVETVFGVDNPIDIAKFEKAQEEQYLSVLASIEPLEQMIGREPGELCTVCFHVGHEQSDFQTCPVARLKSFFSDSSFYDSLSDLTPAVSLIKQDLGYTCQALSWAIKYKGQGYLEQIGIYSTALTDLQALLHAWKATISKETFAFGRFGDMEREILSAEPVNIQMIELVDIPMVNTEGGLYQQKFNQPDEAGDHHPLPEIKQILPGPQLAPADRLKLEILGARPNTICAVCLYRGHVQNSTRFCPFKVVAIALEKMKTQRRKRRIEDVAKQVEQLQKLVDELGPDYNGIKRIIDLLGDWHETVADTLKRKGTKVVEKAPRVPVGFVDHEMADTFTSILQERDHNDALGSPSRPNLTSTHLTLNSCNNSSVVDPSLENGEPLPSARPLDPEDLNQLYSTFDDLEGIPDFCDEDFAASSPPKSSPNAMGDLSTFQEEVQKSISKATATQVLPNTAIGSAQELGEISQNIELPPEILWRYRCTLRTIGVRKDNLCKSCLHYGHDRSSFACPAQLVFQSILKKNDSPLSASSSVDDLKAAIKWQKTIPKNMQGDIEGIQSLVDRWEAAVKQFRETMFEISVDAPVRKRPRRRSPATENQSEIAQSLKAHVESSSPLVRMGYKGQQTATLAPMQMAYNSQHISPNPPTQETYTTQYAASDLPSSPPPIQHSVLKSHPELQSFPAQNKSHKEETNQNKIQNQQQVGLGNGTPRQQQGQQSQQLLPAQVHSAVPEGVFFDYHRIPGHLLSPLMDYVIEETEPGNEDRLLVDHRKMPKSLFLSLRSYLSR